jgi:hypothetical protein
MVRQAPNPITKTRVKQKFQRSAGWKFGFWIWLLLGIQFLEFLSRIAEKLEAAIGFEPMNEGFADLCLSHLATPP